MPSSRPARRHHHVDVVELSDRVWNVPAFRKANPDLRFDQRQANRFVLQYDQQLMPELYEVYTPMPYC